MIPAAESVEVNIFNLHFQQHAGNIDPPAMLEDSTGLILHLIMSVFVFLPKAYFLRSSKFSLSCSLSTSIGDCRVGSTVVFGSKALPFEAQQGNN
jgi:hypothetical protein